VSVTPRPQPGRDRPEWLVAINRNEWSQSIVTGGRNQPMRPLGHLMQLSTGAHHYDYVGNHGHNNLGVWLDIAAKQVGR
jgi:hypothetical protein